MRPGVSAILAGVLLLSELILAVRRRAGQGSRGQDRGSLLLLWGAISAGLYLGFVLRAMLPTFGVRGSVAMMAAAAGVVLFVLGLALRWYAILYLGNLFTVDVAIARDHRLIDTGPYRLVRHPSYTGSLMMLIGVALSLANLTSLAVITIPALLVFWRRMSIEEAVLLQALGEPYRRYMQRTKRLLPAVY